ncbi:anhydro-N-acetylmuramic acid kinase [Candidatus Kuenenia sp.]|uniref:anhydro-N-acetylmuramic acid kinase n=1 Tax=Candidatus Kuenenia sp. TaxID=2499824 RepID=UPI00322004A2
MLTELLRLQGKTTKKIIGLMSGTSVDGIDTCLAEISGNGVSTRVNVLAFATYPYPDSIRNAVLEASNPSSGTVEKICRLNFTLGKLFAEAVKNIANASGISLFDIDLVGSHGQTIYHIPCLSSDSLVHGNMLPAGIAPAGSTLQIGEPSIIAQETGITTVADFRPRDIAAGGHGAPLVPYADFILFRDKEKGRSLQNIGGIANVTFLPKDCNINEVIAFDTGPGNMIIDRITERITNNAAHFDKDGMLAAQGQINRELLLNLQKHSFLSKPPPKTTGREEFGVWYTDMIYNDAVKAGINNMDILATVTWFTAYSIAEGYKQWILNRHSISEVILSGGGCHNKTLLKCIKQNLDPSIRIYPIDMFGITSDSKEALAFAILANETISGNANNVPNATGAREQVVLGKIIPGRRR